MEEDWIGGSCTEQEINGMAPCRENQPGLLWGYDGDGSQHGEPRTPSVLASPMWI